MPGLGIHGKEKSSLDLDSSHKYEFIKYLEWGTDNITNAKDIPHKLDWWRAHGLHFPKHSKMVNDMLAIQGSSIASKQAFNVTRFQIGDNRYSSA